MTEGNAELHVSLNECPPGLFWFGSTLGFKSEYTTTLENPRRYKCDAYVVNTGEYFQGGAKTVEERGELLVVPMVAACPSSPTGKEISEAIKATEYKYFGDYEMSEGQRAAVDTLVTFANQYANGLVVMEARGEKHDGRD